MAGITLPPAGSGHTFHDGCFFRSQGEDKQRERREREGRGRKRGRVNPLFSEGMAFYPRKTFCPTNGPWRSTSDWWRVQAPALSLSHP